jgi:hypothetical protein
LEGAPEAISELTINVEIDFLAGDSPRFKFFTLKCDGRAAPRKLPLTLAKPLRAAEVGDDFRQHVAETPRPGSVANWLNVKPRTVTYGRTRAGRTTNSYGTRHGHGP